MAGSKVLTPEEAKQYFLDQLVLFTRGDIQIQDWQRTGAFQSDQNTSIDIIARRFLGHLLHVAHTDQARLNDEVQLLFNAFVIHSSSLDRNQKMDLTGLPYEDRPPLSPMEHLNKLLISTREATVFVAEFKKKSERKDLGSFTGEDTDAVFLALLKPGNILMPCLEALYEVPPENKSGFEGWLNLNHFIAQVMKDLNDPGAVYAGQLVQLCEEEFGPSGRLEAKGTRAAQSLEYKFPALRIWNKVMGPLLLQEITWVNPQLHRESAGVPPGPLAQAEGFSENTITIKRYKFWLDRLSKILTGLEEQVNNDATLQETLDQGKHLLEEMRFTWPDGLDDDDKVRQKREQGVKEVQEMQSFQIQNAQRQEEKKSGCCVIL